MNDPGFIRGGGIFPCTNCGEMIYSDAEKCRFCSAVVDRVAAEQGAELQAQVNSACNQAKLVRNAAGVMWTFLLLSALPFLPFGWGYSIIFIGLPVWLIFWYVQYGRLETADPDYKVAKRDWKIAVFLWIPSIFFQLFVYFTSRQPREF
jgi:hypothetical protein